MNPRQSKARFVAIMVVAASLSVIVSISILVINHVTPFGNQNLLVGDMGAQYSPFFTYFRHILTTGQFTGFSFSGGIGENIFPLLAYYLLNPFNLIVLLFPANQIPIAITWMLVVKIAAMAMTMSFFLGRHFKKLTWLLPIFAVAYSLCGFVAANFVNIMWLDALIYLPLICNGIDRIKAGRNANQLFIWLTICIIANYYIGYMVGLFTLIYVATAIINDNDQQLKAFALLKINRPFINRFLFAEICSGLTSMIVLLPSALGMMQTAKVNPTTPSAMSGLHPQFGLEIFSQLGLGSDGYTNRLFRAPAVFSSLVVLLLVMVYFVHPKISQQHKLGALTTLGVLILSMLIGPINLVWHMFNEPSGSPFRYSFLLSFVMITIAYEAWIANPNLIKNRFKLSIPLVAISLLICGFCFIKFSHFAPITNYLALQPNSLRTLLLNILLILLLSLLITVIPPKRAGIFIASIILAEMTTNFNDILTSEPLGNQPSYESNFSNQAATLQKATPKSNLYRINQSRGQLARAFQETYLGYNDPLLFHFNGIQEYSSTLNESTRQTLKMLGLFSKNQRRISTAGTSAISNMLLGAKYNVQNKTVTQNQTYVGMGFPVTNQFINLRLKPGYIFSNLENILQRIRATKNPYLVKETINQVKHSQLATNSVQTYTINITPKISGPLYMDTSDKTLNYSQIMVNGYQLKTMTNRAHHAYLLKLGTMKRAVPVTITFKSSARNALALIHLKSLNSPRLNNLVTELRAYSFQPSYKNNQVRGTVTRLANHNWLYTAIPYDSGWSASVNGTTVTSKKVLGNFTAIPLMARTNHITFSYHVPGLLLGIITSMFGLLAYCGDELIKRLLSDSETTKH